MWTCMGTNVIRNVIQLRSGGHWTIEVIPGGSGARLLGNHRPEVIAVTAIDRIGNASLPVVFELREEMKSPKKKK